MPESFCIWVLLPLAGLFLWWVTGCCAMGCIETDNMDYLTWAQSCPLPFGVFLVTVTWPLWVYLHMRDKRRYLRRHGNVSAHGGGRVHVPVADIVTSVKVQGHVKEVRELIKALKDTDT